MRTGTIGILLLLLIGCSSSSSPILDPAECDIDMDCDDGVWCNGTEACVQGSCDVTPPCIAGCDEMDQACFYDITASFLASIFGGGSGECVAVGSPATEDGLTISVFPGPDGEALVHATIATGARAGDVINFSQLFRQNATGDAGQPYSCHFNILVGQELALIEQGFCQTDSGNLECTISIEGVVISDDI